MYACPAFVRKSTAAKIAPNLSAGLSVKGEDMETDCATSLASSFLVQHQRENPKPVSAMRARGKRRGVTSSRLRTKSAMRTRTIIIEPATTIPKTNTFTAPDFLLWDARLVVITVLEMNPPSIPVAPSPFFGPSALIRIYAPKLRPDIKTIMSMMRNGLKTSYGPKPLLGRRGRMMKASTANFTVE